MCHVLEEGKRLNIHEGKPRSIITQRGGVVESHIREGREVGGRKRGAMIVGRVEGTMYA